MKRKEVLCYLLLCAILYQPINAFAVEGQNDSSVQAEAQDEEIQNEGAQTEGAQNELVLKEETETIQSVFDGLTVGADSLGSSSDSKVTDTVQSKEEKDVIDEADMTEDMDGAEMKSADNISNISDLLGEPVGVSSIVEARKTVEEYAKAYEEAKNANWGYTNLGIANVDNNLNIRAIPGEDGKLVGKLPKDAACEVLESDGSWAHIRSGKVDGYVSCDFLLTGLQAKRRAEELATTIATVTTDSLKVRAEANTDSEVITLVPNGEELEVVASEGDWVRVCLDDEEVFVSAQYVQVDAKLNTAITMTELLYGQGVSDVRVDLCQYAKEFLGNPYVWGGTSLTNGTDCSGFVLSVYKKFGISLPHYSGSQANCGTAIKLSEAQPGDLIFYGKGSTINHVAIYIGGGQVIHASNPKTGIRISNATYRTPLKVVRILQDY